MFAALDVIVVVVVSLSENDKVGATVVDLQRSCPTTSTTSCLLENLIDSYEDSLKLNDSQSMPALQVLVIQNSALRRIPSSQLLDVMPNLEKLLLLNCGINSLNEKDFSGIHRLKILALKENSIFTLAKNVFQPLAGSLEELQLRSNRIHILNRQAFGGLQNLNFLDISYNNVISLQGGVFEPLPNLEYLDLSHNNLEAIDGNTFSKNPKLSTLNLSDNKFSVYEPNSLAHFKHLKILDLSNSLLEDLYLQSVDLLQISNSGLKTCTVNGGVLRLLAANNSLSGIKIGNKLEVLDIQLQGNYFEALDDFQGMVNLRSLDISHNHVGGLISRKSSAIYLHLPNLEYLNLAHNRLRQLSANQFLMLSELRSLDLSHNQLLQLPTGVLRPLKGLRQLYLDNNHLVDFNCTQLKQQHPALQQITLDGNDWEEQYQGELILQLQQQNITVRRHMPGYDMDNYLNSHEMPPPTPFEHYEKQQLIGSVSGIHPYWTLRDVLALITLLLVLIILLLQFFRILQEEQCCRRRFFQHDHEAEQPLVHNSSVL
ncbi:chaoptin-like [Musca vetustissima]|uniref:chaoptin-like n=1 Tax=Musca vetustissima TaxID=27455 RepID=UPI002AB7EA13|nr:chaoptin-like [Musca vetustissima]